MSIEQNNKILASDISTALNNKQDKLSYTPVKSVNGTVADTAGNVSTFTSDGKLQFPNGTQIWVA